MFLNRSFTDTSTILRAVPPRCCGFILEYGRSLLLERSSLLAVMLAVSCNSTATCVLHAHYPPIIERILCCIYPMFASCPHHGDGNVLFAADSLTLAHLFHSHSLSLVLSFSFRAAVFLFLSVLVESPLEYSSHCRRSA